MYCMRTASIGKAMAHNNFARTFDQIISQIHEFVKPYLNIYPSDATQLSTVVQRNGSNR